MEGPITLVNTEGGADRPPEISFLQKDTNVKAGKFPGKKERITEFETPLDIKNLKKSEYDEILIETREAILNDEDLLRKLVLAVKEKTQNGSVGRFADIENVFIERCMNLTDTDIDNMLRQLNTKLLDHVRRNQGLLDIPGKTLQDLSIGKFNLDSKGIKSVINFVRERIGLLMLNPEQNFRLGFNSVYDAKNKVDLIEVILDNAEENIEQINLIQIKSSNPSEKDITDITKEHRNLANRDILSMKEVNSMRLGDASSQESMRVPMDDQVAMLEKLFEICSDYQAGDTDTLLKTLGLDKLNNLQRVWVLEARYGKIIDTINVAYDSEYITEENKNNLISDLEVILRTSINKSGVPLKFIPIKIVNSIVAVGPRIISQVEIYNSQNSGNPLMATR